MTDTPTTPQENAQGFPAMPLVVNAQYVKDLSFENPSPLKSFQTADAPEIVLNVNINAEKLPEGTNMFEVVLHLTADAKRQDTRVFLAELQYGGIFTITEGVPEQAFHPLLMIECPRMLFPYARHVMAQVTREGGYPALALGPIDFVELYRRQYANQAQDQSQDQNAKAAAKAGS